MNEQDEHGEYTPENCWVGVPVEVAIRRLVKIYLGEELKDLPNYPISAYEPELKFPPEIERVWREEDLFDG